MNKALSENTTHEQSPNDERRGLSVLNVRCRPKRIQRKRTKGWKMPPNTVYVGRPTKWGNPFRPDPSIAYTLQDVLADYREHILLVLKNAPSLLDLKELRGKNLACWCKLHKSGPDECHAAILLELANKGGNDI